MLKDHQKRLINLFMEQEIGLAELYSMFSESFPAQKDLWFSLSSEELHHASMIKELYDRVLAGDASFHEGNTKTYTVQAFIEYVRSLKDRFSSDKPSPGRALSLALDLEKALIENKIFDFFTSDSVELKNLLSRLKEDTKGHIARIKKFWAETRGWVPA